MESTTLYPTPPRTQSYLRSLLKAIEKTHQLLEERSLVPDYEQIHQVKSLLYAAIERAGMEAERSSSVQQTLRELLMLVSIRSDAQWHERQEALQRLEDLKSQI